MKKNILEYKGYHTVIEFDAETFVLHGKFEGIKDFVNFESEDPRTIEQEFRTAVDDYLEFCRAVGKEPDKEYKGTWKKLLKPMWREAKQQIRNCRKENIQILHVEMFGNEGVNSLPC